MTRLEPIGYFVESYPAFSNVPLADLLCAKSVDYDVSRMRNYLAEAWIFNASMDYLIDVLDPTHPELSIPNADVTDGVYVWPLVITYYLGKSALKLPSEFVKHVEMRGYIPPPRKSMGPDVVKRFDITIASLRKE
jgi:hypothetical protein